MLRRWFRRLERRWIPDAADRNRHEAIVRDRLPGDVKPQDDTGATES